MKVVAISSGKGGVGKTTVTVNLGLALAARGDRVLLVDADLGLANIDLVAGVEVQRTLADALFDDAPLEQVLVDVAPRVRLLPASSGVLRLERLTREERLALLDRLRSLASQFDVMLLDTSAGITENVLFFDRVADEVLVVTTPDPTAITDCYALLKILLSAATPLSAHVLVNQASAPEAAETHKRLAHVCRQFLGYAPGYAGHVPRDPSVESSIRERKPAVLSRPTAAASRCFLRMAETFDAVFKSSPRNLAPPAE